MGIKALLELYHHKSLGYQLKEYCPHVPAWKFNETFKEIHFEHFFWTTAIFYDGDFPTEKEFPFAFISSDNLVQTYLSAYIDKTMNAYSLTTGDYQFEIIAYYSKHHIDNEYAIFRSLPSVYKIHYNQGLEEFEIVQNLSPVLGSAIDYAMVYAASNGDFRIFQSCDMKFAWVQIQNEQMHSRHSGERTNSLRDFWNQIQEVRHTLNLGVNQKIFEGTNFSVKFDHTSAILQLIEEITESKIDQ